MTKALHNYCPPSSTELSSNYGNEKGCYVPYYTKFRDFVEVRIFRDT